MNNIFYNDNTLIQFDRQEQWEESIIYLVKLALCNLEDSHILYRLAAQCWYVLTFWDCNIPKEILDRKVFETNLEIAYNLAKNRWWNDANCLWLFGYFMFVNQIDFPYVSSDICDVEKEGRDLIRKSFFLDPNNQLAEIMYLADNTNNRKYYLAKKKLKESISLYFPSHSRVDEYFSDIFTSAF